MHVCVCVRWSVPAAGAGLQPRGLICPAAINWGHWHPGSAAEQTECVSLAAGSMRLVHMHRRIYSLLLWTSTLLSQRGERDEPAGAVCVWATALCAWVTCAAGHVYTCI